MLPLVNVLQYRRRMSILMNIFMPTSVHIPKPLLAAVDRKARTLNISRNRLIVRALAKEVTPGSDWSPHFFERLSQVDDKVSAAVDEALVVIRSSRSSKKPPQL